MIRSMTGYGRAEAAGARLILSVECKSVNHRHLDVALKLPRVLGAFEADARRLIQAAVQRGRVDVERDGDRARGHRAESAHRQPGPGPGVRRSRPHARRRALDLGDGPIARLGAGPAGRADARGAGAAVRRGGVAAARARRSARALAELVERRETEGERARPGAARPRRDAGRPRGHDGPARPDGGRAAGGAAPRADAGDAGGRGDRRVAARHRGRGVGGQDRHQRGAGAPAGPPGPARRPARRGTARWAARSTSSSRRSTAR